MLFILGPGQDEEQGKAKQKRPGSPRDEMRLVVSSWIAVSQLLLLLVVIVVVAGDSCCW